MAWNAPITWTPNQTVTSAQLNAQISQNMLETAPAKAVGGSWPQLFAVVNTNSITAREIKDNSVGGSDTTTNTSYVNLASTGPTVSLTTGAFALCFPSSRIKNSAGGFSYTSFDITGATTSAATDGRGVMNQGTDDLRAGATQLIACTAGANVFTMKYRVSSGTGTYEDRRFCVMGL